jgi:hypothetical protein
MKLISYFKNWYWIVRSTFGEQILKVKLQLRVYRFASTSVNEIDESLAKTNILNYMKSMKADEDFQYYYSSMSKVPSLYASAYACMNYSLLGELSKCNKKTKEKWASYFDSFQDEKDGLFYDPNVNVAYFKDSDWWGARHLALHLVRAYSDLGQRPRYPFIFLSIFYGADQIKSWIDSYDWDSKFGHDEDIDNKIMNIGCLLQYQRDYFEDESAAEAVNVLKSYLLEKINPSTGLWGSYDPDIPRERSRMVQFAYHLFSIYFYDEFFDFDHENIIKFVLLTQNSFGGYGPKANSSACEDIDSIDILCRFYSYASLSLQTEIRESLEKSFSWIMLNQVGDGGFVFRLYEAMTYGHKEMSSGVNMSGMFPTWFRTLSLKYIMGLNGIQLDLLPAPGYLLPGNKQQSNLITSSTNIASNDIKDKTDDR